MTLSKCDRCGFTEEPTSGNTRSVRSTYFSRDGVDSVYVDLCRSCYDDVTRFIRQAIDGPTQPAVAAWKVMPS